MTEKDKVEGKVARVTDWSSHKGYFLNIADDSNDYYGFGKCKGQVGETVEIEVSEGTGNFSDKIRIDKLYSKATVKEAVKETADKDMEIVAKSIESGENTYFARQNLIIRQTCIKAAAVIVVGEMRTNPVVVETGIIERTLFIAERLYAWVTESDLKLPEPPEEP
ncbi:hypothetical protein LCGC14_2161730 [marine sediment metagenome]|uniref:Uncharacterized protein n=1 Tax=marine sediment metagenome TaxID=412755 RepID=A0A0F9DSQ5_9ZZZZ